jgi:hypothetical protein
MNAAKIRFRPILMTAFAFILGCMPLWFATGSGGVSRQILGTVVIGGMLAATSLAIFLIPATYSLAERISNKLGADRDGSLEKKGAKDSSQYDGPSQTLADLEREKAGDLSFSEQHSANLNGGRA